MTLHATPSTRADLSEVTLAVALAERAAQHAGISVRSLEDLADVRAASALLSTVWGTSPESPPVTGDLLRALSHAGGYVFGVYLANELVGASVGFLGFHDQLSLHSHITGLLEPARNRGAGFAVKTHQRAWALDHGVETITWTFDPLQRRNAYFNVAKLGAEIDELLPNFYGDMRDTINLGDESDRFATVWRLTSPRALAALDRVADQPIVDLDPTEDDPRVVLGTTVDGRPRVGNPTGDLIFVPDEIAKLRASDPDLGHAWRIAVREAAVAKLESGMLHAVTNNGWYVFDGGNE